MIELRCPFDAKSSFSHPILSESMLTLLLKKIKISSVLSEFTLTLLLIFSYLLQKIKIYSVLRRLMLTLLLIFSYLLQKTSFLPFCADLFAVFLLFWRRKMWVYLLSLHNLHFPFNLLGKGFPRKLFLWWHHSRLKENLPQLDQYVFLIVFFVLLIGKKKVDFFIMGFLIWWFLIIGFVVR